MFEACAVVLVRLLTMIILVSIISLDVVGCNAIEISFCMGITRLCFPRLNSRGRKANPTRNQTSLLVVEKAFKITYQRAPLTLLVVIYCFRTLGLYSKTFAKIIYADISKFFVVFLIVGLAFTGGVYLALKAAKGLDKVG